MPEEMRLATQKRLEEIERELGDLRTEHASLKARWETEKKHIQSIRAIKAEIEDVKVRAADAERNPKTRTAHPLRTSSQSWATASRESMKAMSAPLEQRTRSRAPSRANTRSSALVPVTGNAPGAPTTTRRPSLAWDARLVLAKRGPAALLAHTRARTHTRPNQKR